MEKKEIRKKGRRAAELFFVILKFTLLIALLVGIPLYIYFFQNEWLDNFKSMEAAEAFLSQYKTASIFVYIGMQVIQLVICFIPGQALQFVAGYAFAFWLGYLFSMIGCAIGTILTFYLARGLGKEALGLLFGQEKFGRFVDKLNTKRAFIGAFIIYLIPGLPKDLVAYAAGVSNMKLKPLLIVSLVGRTPAMMVSIMIGSMVNKESYFGVCVLAVAAVVLCILGIWKHKQLTKQMDRWYVKMMKPGSR